jgi:uncharacterized repeat protein (TIGR03987 family)
VLVSAIVLITAALVFYSTGVFSERRAGRLRVGHVGLFGAGLTFDATGTALMTVIASDAVRAQPGRTRGVLDVVMAFTGAAALALMAIHLVWAVVVLIRDRKAERLTFHRFSLAVWALWLIPYVTGALSSAL